MLQDAGSAHLTEADEVLEPLFTRLTLRDAANVSPPSYILQDLIPSGHVTLLGGHGGAGKSQLGLTLAAHCAAGREWASRPMAKRRAVFVSLEDPADLTLHRLRKIVAAYGLPPDQVEGGLEILDGSGGDTFLAYEDAFEGRRTLRPHYAMEELHEAVSGAGLVVVDNASDAFLGNENDRRQVRTFMRMLAGIARANDGAVLLLAHIDKQAARNGSGGNSYSGSTAWHNSARSRMALLNDQAGVRVEHEKLNVGKKQEALQLRWTDNGVLMPATRMQIEIDRREQCRDDQAAVMEAVRRAFANGVSVPTGQSGPATSWHALEPLLPDGLRTKGEGKRRTHAAMLALNEAGSLRRVSYRDANRNAREKWEPTQGPTP